MMTSCFALTVAVLYPVKHISYAHKRICFDADSEQWVKKRDIEDVINWDEVDFDATDVNSPIGSKSQQSEHTDPPPIIDFF